MSLQNTGVTVNGNTRNSLFVDPVLGRTVTFNTKTSSVRLKSTSVDVVNLTARLNQPTPVGAPACDPCSSDSVVQSAELKINVVKGDLVSITAYRKALNELVDQAIANYQFAFGLVPPASAVFTDDGV